MERKDVSIGILSGGRSRRFGSDKREALLGEKTFLETLLSSFSSFEDVLLSVGKNDEGKYRENLHVVKDRETDLGPMEGMCRILEEANHDLVFLLPVDMPLLTPPVLDALSSFLSSDIDAVLLSLLGRSVVLPVLCRKSVLSVIEKKLEEKDLRLMSVFRSVRTRMVAIEELPFPKELFLNINDRTSYEELLSSMERKGI